MENNTVVMAEGYDKILDKYGFSYTTDEVMLQVGEIPMIKGWILHISVVSCQFKSLLEVILPVLKKYSLSFKLPHRKDVLSSILGGQLGYVKLGKVITIYTVDPRDAVAVANEINEITDEYKGPVILTDFRIGSVLYTRYGFFHTEVIGEGYSIPPEFPDGVSWPFEKKYDINSGNDKGILKNRYKKLLLLKEDARGNVYKGFFLKHGFIYKSCVIKEGKSNMGCDDYGRCIHDRLKWQEKVHSNLFGKISIPKIYDFFEEGGNSYLIMEFIKGEPVDDIILGIYKNRRWMSISLSEKIQILDLIIKMLSLLKEMHKYGYVHRDFNGGNMLLNRRGEIIMIDLELVYSINDSYPKPAFSYGTIGFMSPEQKNIITPTTKEDIYAAGAVLLVMLTGLYPAKFDISNTDEFKNQLGFYIEDKEIIDIILKSMSELPEFRPEIDQIIKAVKQFRDKQNSVEILDVIKIDSSEFERVIKEGIKGISGSEMKSMDGLWMSRSVQHGFEYYQMDGASIYGGMYAGVSGVMYLVTQLKKAGYQVSDCVSSYISSIGFVQDNYLTKINEVPAGFYHGVAGITVTIYEGLSSGFLERDENAVNSITEYLRNCFSSYLDMENGIAGIGVAILRCSPLMRKDVVDYLLKNCIEKIIKNQEKDGSWITENGENGKEEKDISWKNGSAGIIYFLVNYAKLYGLTTELNECILKGVRWMIKHRKSKVKPNYKYDLGFDKGDSGIAFSLIHVFEFTNDITYLKEVENILLGFPEHIVIRDLSFSSGVCGIGEVYLEVARITGNEMWMRRAEDIAQLCIYSTKTSDNGGKYWIVDNNINTTADFMVGNSGIIHFILRFKHQELKHFFSIN